MCGNCGRSGHNRRTCSQGRVALDTDTKLIRARTDQVDIPRRFEQTLEEPTPASREVVSDATDRAVPLRPRRERNEGADLVVVRQKRKHAIAAAAHAKVLIGPPAPADESPLPVRVADLSELGGSSFDVKRAWGGGRGGRRPSPATTTGGDEPHEGT